MPESTRGRAPPAGACGIAVSGSGVSVVADMAPILSAPLAGCLSGSGQASLSIARTALRARELPCLPRRSEREDEVAGLLFIGGMAELITAWLDGAVEATSDDFVAAANRSFLGLYG